MRTTPKKTGISVFDYKSYKSYILDALEVEKYIRGSTQKNLAEALRCQPAYVSQVLNGSPQFSLEQAEDTNGFFEHSNEEAEFFLLLVQHERAGTTRLRKRVKQQIDRVLEGRLILRKRVDIQATLPLETQLRYYSSWHYAAVHVAISVPGLTTKSALTKELNIPPAKLNEVIEFLIQAGLITDEHGIFRQGVSRIFLGSDSPMISKHHANWRMKAIDACDRARADDLHLSTVVSLSQADFETLREQLVRSINDMRAVIKESKEERVACLAVDFFSLY